MADERADLIFQAVVWAGTDKRLDPAKLYNKLTALSTPALRAIVELYKMQETMATIVTKFKLINSLAKEIDYEREAPFLAVRPNRRERRRNRARNKHR
jgi:hypothetical protein